MVDSSSDPSLALQIQGLIEVCDKHKMWLHVEGDECLSLTLGEGDEPNRYASENVFPLLFLSSSL